MITDYSSYSISIFSWLFISIQRYNQIVSQSIINEDLNKKRLIILVLIWLLSYLFWSLMALPIVLTDKNFSYECEYIYSFLYVILVEIFNLIIPILLIIIINIMIYIELRKHIKRSYLNGVKNSLKVSNLIKKKARKFSFKTTHLTNNSNLNNLHHDSSSTKLQNLTVPNNNNEQDMISFKNSSSSLSAMPQINSNINSRKSSIFSIKNYKLTKDRKAYVSLFAINVSLILSWLLFLFVWPLKAYCGTDCVSNRLYDISVWLIYSSSCTNAILLITFNTELNNLFKDILINNIFRLFKKK
jgi:hypothetical protein